MLYEVAYYSDFIYINVYSSNQILDNIPPMVCISH